VILLTDMLVFALFAASLHFLMGPGGLYSFGHAAYFGIGAYAAGILMLRAGLPAVGALALAPFLAAAAALLFGWFCVRLSGVYSAMLTLAFAQIAWSAVFQWDALTGGSNGLVGLWPPSWLASKTAYYYLSLLLCSILIMVLVKIIHSEFGYALRASRDSPQRAEASGIDVRATQWRVHDRGARRGPGGRALRLFQGLDLARVARHPALRGWPGDGDAGRPADAYRAHLGAALFTWLQDATARSFDYWRAATGAIVLILVMLLPGGLGSCCDGAHDQARGRQPVQGLRRRARTARRELWRGAGRDAGDDRPERRWQDNLLQSRERAIARGRWRVRFEGARIDGLPPRKLCRLGIGRTFQVAATFGSMTVRENFGGGPEVFRGG
jgi:branched-chain amino acid transport system permease protein